MVGIDADVRLNIAEGIVKEFTDLVRNKKIPLTINKQKILTRLNEIKSKLMALKWSYKPQEQVLLSKELRDIEIFIKEIFDEFPENWENHTLEISSIICVNDLNKDFQMIMQIVLTSMVLKY